MEQCVLRCRGIWNLNTALDTTRGGYGYGYAGRSTEMLYLSHPITKLPLSSNSGCTARETSLTTWHEFNYIPRRASG
jgi:hypothetical protein